MTVRALYVHVPFCHAKCAYCDFDSCGLTGERLARAAGAYLAQLESRIDAFGACGALEDVETAYIGGGTPTVLGEGLAALVAHIRRWCAPSELTCEANPESFDEALAQRLAAAGATRISLGVQSLDDDELGRIGRLHSACGALAALERARRHGFTVSCDLMCGLPGQTGASWRATLARTVEARPDHVSVYPLTLEEGTPLARRAERDPRLVPDEDFQASCMETSASVLAGAGYARYEVASYALPGRRCRHNCMYWTGAGYLGIGRSAAGMLDGATYLRLRRLFPGGEGDAPARSVDPHDRVRLVQLDDAAARFDIELLHEREALAEDLMLGMRMTDGVDRALIARAAACMGDGAVDGALRDVCAAGLAAWTDAPDGAASWREHAPGARLVPTERGWLLGNELYARFWDLATEAS